MTEPDGRPPRRRRRPHRQSGAGLAGTPAEPRQRAATAAAPVQAPVQDDAGGSPPNQPAGPAKDPPNGDSANRTGDSANRNGDPARKPGESAKGRRDGEPSRVHGRDAERGWRELAGSSPSQVGVSGALRARDVARPTAEDLAAAERSVTVVRRHWQPEA